MKACLPGFFIREKRQSIIAMPGLLLFNHFEQIVCELVFVGQARPISKTSDSCMAPESVQAGVVLLTESYLALLDDGDLLGVRHLFLAYTSVTQKQFMERLFKRADI